jgi:FkbM family methyltransferase
MLIEFDKVKEHGIIPKGVIHVGMHKAEEYPIYKASGVEDILFVEANRELAHGWDNQDDRCIVVHAAVSDKEEEVEFHITNNGESSSILELGDHAKIYPHIVNIETVKMTTITLDNILYRVCGGFSPYNIMNLDIQGAELKAMKGFSFWESIDAIFTEINYREMYIGCASEVDITSFLDEKGFDKIEEVDTGAGWGDALYIKRK